MLSIESKRRLPILWEAMRLTRGRFAPSPSGRMHLGNAFTALMAWLSAKAEGGEVVLRIEDLDPNRSRAEYARAIMDDLRWLGLNWDRRAPDQSLRGKAYEAAIQRLEGMGLVYPCYCTRGQLHASSAPHASDGRALYAGTCRNLTPEQRAAKGATLCLRAVAPDKSIAFTDGLQGPQSMNLAAEWGDFIVRRSDGVAAYQLAVVVDDAENGISQVVRGRDLLSSAAVQLWLYEALGLRAPSFCHVPMLLSPDRRRLSKREHALELGELRRRMPPERVVGYLAWRCGLLDRRQDISPGELLTGFSWSRVQREDIVVDERDLI